MLKILSVVGISVLFAQSALAGSIIENLKVGDMFPAAEVLKRQPLNTDEIPRSLSGKPSIVVYWASWCPHCRNQTHLLGDLYKKYSSKGFKVLGIDGDVDHEKGKAYAKAELPFPSVYDRDKELYDQWKIHGVPVTFLLDARGKITQIIAGDPPSAKPLIEKFAAVAVGEAE